MSTPRGWRQLGDVIARHGMERRHLLRALQRLPDFHMSSQEVDAILRHVRHRGGPTERYTFGSRSSRCWEALERDLEAVHRLPPPILTPSPHTSAIPQQQHLSTPPRGLAEGEPGDGPASVPEEVGEPQGSQQEHE